MMSIALYARVSSQQQAQRATIDSQIAALKERAVADGHTVLPTDLYLDEGYSGATLVRPALERLRDRVAEGGVDVLYVHSPDRLARRYAYQVLLLEEFAARTVRVIFLQGASGQTAEDTLLTQVQGMLAEYERAHLMERYRRGKLHRARQGLVNPLSGAPYGYRYIARTVTEPARYDVEPTEATVVRAIFDALVQRQQSIGQIVRDLNAAGTPTRRGAARWDRTTVWGILHNPAYIGEAAYGKTEAIERGPRLRPIRNKPLTPRHAKSTTRDRSPEEWIRIPVPSLVASEVFAAARDQLERNKRLAARNGRGQRYLLQGLVVCAQCGYAFYGKRVSLAARKGRNHYAYYRCVGCDSYRFAGGRVCHNPQVRVDALDQHVWDAVRQTIEDPSRVLDEWARRAETDSMQVERRAACEAATQVVTGLERSVTRLIDAYEAGALDLADLTTRRTRLQGRLVAARAAQKEAETQLAEVVTLRSVTGRLEDFAARVRVGLAALTWEGRRELIRLLVARVELDAEGATIVFRLPPNHPTEGPEAPPNATGGAGTEACYQLRGRRAFPVTQQHRPRRARSRAGSTRALLRSLCRRCQHLRAQRACRTAGDGERGAVHRGAPGPHGEPRQERRRPSRRAAFPRVQTAA